MPVTVEDLLESATKGVLRALDARREGSQVGALKDQRDVTNSGFYVNVHLRCGIPPVVRALEAAQGGDVVPSAED